MNRYSENIAELLLLGRTELDDFYAARTSLDEGLIELSNLIELEIDLVRSAAERQREGEELQRVAEMRSLFESIDLTAQRMLFLREQGRQDEAIATFRDTVEESLDADLEDHIAAAIADEESELRAIEERTNRLESQLVLLIVAVSLAAILISGAAGALLTGALTRPIRELIAATRAVGDGNLSYRINYDQLDEFADLARQFNKTTGQIEVQRRQLLEVQPISRPRSLDAPANSRTPTVGSSVLTTCACCFSPRSATSCARPSRSCVERQRWRCGASGPWRSIARSWGALSNSPSRWALG
jgi:HAMP domain-containing protein